MMLNAVMLLGGLAFLIIGGELLVRGATVCATRLRIAPVIVGLTVVAFGTSTPELVVNLSAALRDEGNIGFGNIVGSNIANVGLLLAITAVVFPLAVHRSIVRREVPMLVLACAAALALCFDGVLNVGDDAFSRGDGLVLLLLFCVFLYYTVHDALQQREIEAPVGDDFVGVATTPHASALRIGMLIIGGLLLLIGGGEATVRAGVAIAASAGVPDVVVGLTLIAVGTSLPELATTITAARRGSTDMAVGNIVGSNIFNLLFILGLSATITPIQLPQGGRIDVLVMALFAAALVPIALTVRRISRAEGLLLLVGYACFIGWLASR